MDAMNETRTRREFLKTTATIGIGAAGFPYFVPGRALGDEGATVPSAKIVMGCVGIGSMGGGHLRGFSGQEDVRVVAVCDLRRKFREKAKQTVDQRYGDTGCTMHQDYRELLARPDIDAVCIARRTTGTP
jgi:hypothetical protein